MRRTAISSSSIQSVGYDPGSGVLEVEFVGGGVYRYTGVPAELVETLLAARSVGRMFNAWVRDRYPCTRVD